MKTPMWASSGFTLLELLMVLLLIGLMVGAGLTLDFAGAPSSQQAVAAQVSEQVRLAALEAVQSGDPWALDFYRDGTEDGYRWLHWQEDRWQDADPALLDSSSAGFRLPPALGWQVSIDGTVLQPVAPEPLQRSGGAPNPRVHPAVVLLPSREATPFTLRLCTRALESCAAQVSVDALARVGVDDAASH